MSETIPSLLNSDGGGNGAPAIEFRGVEKRYGRLIANDDVNLAIAPGAIQGIVGENGAGKSTLMKMLAGWETPDRGEIRLSGRAARLRTSSEAMRHGIAMVFQHFMMVDRLPVIDNLMLFRKGPFFLRQARGSLRERAQAIMQDYGLAVPLELPFGELPLGQRQRAEIIKALLGEARILILDEPTAVLTPSEATDLFRMLRRLRSEGCTILFVTHKLHEVMQLCDRVTVMRQGRIVATHEIVDVSSQMLADLMIGKADARPAGSRTPVGSSLAMSVRDMKLTTRGGSRLDIEMLDLARGEILGIAGVSGNGQTQLLEVLSGQTAPDRGTLIVNGREFQATGWPNAHTVRQAGIGHIPEDRQEAGLLLELPIFANFVLGQEHRPENSRGGIMRLDAQLQTAAELIAAFDIRTTSPRNSAGSLSGGNQQKVVVARELHFKPSVLLVGQPTRGVDIGAIRYIHERLIEYRNAGGSVLLVSAELDELFALADRIQVAFDGRLYGSFPRADFGSPRIGQYMAGLF